MERVIDSSRIRDTPLPPIPDCSCFHWKLVLPLREILLTQLRRSHCEFNVAKCLSHGTWNLLGIMSPTTGVIETTIKSSHQSCCHQNYQIHHSLLTGLVTDIKQNQQKQVPSIQFDMFSWWVWYQQMMRRLEESSVRGSEEFVEESTSRYRLTQF